MEDDWRAQRAQALATRALSLARAGAAPDAAAVVLAATAHGDASALGLARARCQAAADQNPADTAANRASALLAAAYRRLTDADGPA